MAESADPSATHESEALKEYAERINEALARTIVADKANAEVADNSLPVGSTWAEQVFHWQDYIARTKLVLKDTLLLEAAGIASSTGRPSSALIRNLVTGNRNLDRCEVEMARAAEWDAKCAEIARLRSLWEGIDPKVDPLGKAQTWLDYTSARYGAGQVAKVEVRKAQEAVSDLSE